MPKADAHHVTFDGIEDRIRDQPLHVQRYGVDVAVVLSPERYKELITRIAGPNVRPEVVELMDASVRKHDAIYRALAEIEKKSDI
jgi:hypothetical protein